MFYIYRGHKYRIYRPNETSVVAVTTYYGKRVRATAKCSPNDKFNLEFGMNLACARCALKVENLRNKTICEALASWNDVYDVAVKQRSLLIDKHKDSGLRKVGINADIKALYASL